MGYFFAVARSFITAIDSSAKIASSFGLTA